MPARGGNDLPRSLQSWTYHRTLTNGITQGDIDTAAPHIPYGGKTRHESCLCIYGGLEGYIRIALCKSFKLGIGARFMLQVYMGVDQAGHHRTIFQVDDLVTGRRGNISFLNIGDGITRDDNGHFRPHLQRGRIDELATVDNGLLSEKGSRHTYYSQQP